MGTSETFVSLTVGRAGQSQRCSSSQVPRALTLFVGGDIQLLSNQDGPGVSLGSARQWPCSWQEFPGHLPPSTSLDHLSIFWWLSGKGWGLSVLVWALDVPECLESQLAGVGSPAHLTFAGDLMTRCPGSTKRPTLKTSSSRRGQSI